MQNFQTSAQYLKGVGPRIYSLLNRLNIHTIEDLLYFFPRDYEDRSCFAKIRDLQLNKIQTIQGKIVSADLRQVRKNLSLFKVRVSDGTGSINIIYFNQKYLEKVLVQDKTCIFSGLVENKMGLQIGSASYEFLSGDEDDLLHTGRIVPMYPLTEGVSQRLIRRCIKNVLDLYLDKVSENLSPELHAKYGLIPKNKALLNIHFPCSYELKDKARHRLIFEEFFILQTGIAIKKSKEDILKHGVICKPKGRLTDNFLSSLPFELTGAQKRVIKEISLEMCSPNMMHRLVQGDVGSGKTIVAVYALLLSVQSGYQAVLMAPTEILAEQHFIVLGNLLKGLAVDVKIGLLVGGKSKKEKNILVDAIKNKEIDIVVGTHALLEDDVVFNNLGLVIIDEQHKFGVMQRARLRAKAKNPDMLIMTATPIPRTMTMTVYGDLDVSIIDEMPKGRKPIKTYHIRESKKNDMCEFVRKQLNEGRQAYFVYPLVEDSEKIDLKSAVKFKEHLSEIFSEFKVALLHGKMASKEKDELMHAFKQRQYDILVATTVIEVGIDVSNASIIVVEDANRFGLAQLHQLRGRVGRGEYQSYCILVAEPKTQESRQRMKVMTSTNDGFKIAEEDLIIRGPGEIFGFKQHGIPELRIGSFIEDYKIMDLARKEAFANMPKLMVPDIYNSALIADVMTRYKGKVSLASVG